MTPNQAVNSLHQLVRETRVLRESVRSLMDSGGFESASDVRNLRFSQLTFDNAAVLFERLANLIESDERVCAAANSTTRVSPGEAGETESRRGWSASR